MDKKEVWSGIAIALIVGALLFYWYGYRPVATRKLCFVQAERSLKAGGDTFDAEIFAMRFNDKARDEQIDIEYKNCIRRRGINE